MLRNLIVLPDGTEIFSGLGAFNAIKSVKFTGSVNEQTELAFGSACSSMMEASIITPYGGLNIAAGSEVTAYKVEDDGTRHLVGLYTLEKSTRPTANTYKITAYDRVSWLDKDLTKWLAALDTWPIELLTFAQMVCTECGLTLTNESIPNGAYLVPQFTGDGVTGRKLMRWVGEICARFLRATPEGDVEFAKYAPNTAYTIGPYKRAAVATLSSSVTISDDGVGNVVISSDLMTVEDDGEGNVTVTSDVLNVTDNAGNVVVSAVGGAEVIPYYQSSLFYEDYQVALIEKVQVRLTDDDIGVVYPDVEGEANTYIITGNYLLTTSTTDELLPVAQVIYEEISGITYTPCRVSIPVCLGINPGDIISVIDKNGVTFTAYVMTKTTTGQRDTLECTGSPRRDSSSAINNEEYRALSGKILEIRKQVEGLTIKNADANGRIAQLEMTVDGINTKVESQNEAIGQVQQDMTAIQQSTESVSIQVQNIIDNGVSKVITGKGYEFGDDGMCISDPTSEVENLIDHTGMMVSNTDEMVLQANKDGVNTLNLTVRKYLIVPGARYEEYDDGTGEKFTACFAL